MSQDKNTILLEEYRQVHEGMRNLDRIHWQIAMALFVLMGILIGYGLPKAESIIAKILVGVSVIVILALHCSTMEYFKRLSNHRRKHLKTIEKELEKELKIDDEHVIRATEKISEERGKMHWYWKHHPIIGIGFIAAALFIFSISFFLQENRSAILQKPLVRYFQTDTHNLIRINLDSELRKEQIKVLFISPNVIEVKWPRGEQIPLTERDGMRAKPK